MLVKRSISFAVIKSEMAQSIVDLMEIWGVSGFFCNLLGNISSSYTRFCNSVDRVMMGHCKFWIFLSFNGLVAIGSWIFFLVVLAWAYMSISLSPQPVIRSFELANNPNLSNDVCNVFEGTWVRDNRYPLYNASRCPFAEKGFNCIANGRKDREYTKWRWKPRNCDIPSFDARKVLEKLRGKRVVFVGDSLSRTQWESFLCMLMTAVDDRRNAYEINGNKISKQIRFLGVWFSSYNLRVDFYRSIFLVKSGSVPIKAPKRVKTALKLDEIDDISHEWIDSDILVFNSGHWWTRSKLHDMGWYFQMGNSLKLGMPINTAFRKAMETWASWVQTNINTKRTRVFFRAFESSHWSGKNRNSCKVTRIPSKETNGKDRSPFSDTITKVVNKMHVPVTLLHVTPMGAFRTDGHVGTYGDNPSVPDCSHWCLPGVPDMWNEILFSYYLSNDGISFQ